MRCISLSEPWGSLIALGQKKFETRGWKSSYRGPLGIHVSKGFPHDCQSLCFQEPFFSALGGRMDVLKSRPLGKVIALVDLVDILATEMVATAIRYKLEFKAELNKQGPLPHGEHELDFGDYTPGRYAWRLENLRVLKTPIPAKGALSLWEWTPPDVLEFTDGTSLVHEAAAELQGSLL